MICSDRQMTSKHNVRDQPSRGLNRLPFDYLLYLYKYKIHYVKLLQRIVFNGLFRMKISGKNAFLISMDFEI